MSYNIPTKYINKLAKAKNVKYFRREQEDVLKDLELNHKVDLEYLENIFQYSSKYVTLLKPESNFPDKSNTPESFIEVLINEGEISRNQINMEWRPSLSESIKVCSIKHDYDNSIIYLKLVVGKEAVQKNGWNKTRVIYPRIVPIAVDFQNKLLELRCSKSDLTRYKEHIMKIMGFAAPYKAVSVPLLTKTSATALCKILSAGIISSHISLSSSSIGSIRFNGMKGIDLENDETLKKIKKAFESEGLSTNDTMDQEAVFKFTDLNTQIEFDVFLHVDIVEGYFKFKEDVNEAVINYVKKALMKVTEQSANLSSDEIATNIVVKEMLESEKEVAAGQGNQLILDF